MPKITAAQMAGNHLVDGAWCAGCGLHAYVNNGAHRGDCTRGRHHRAGDSPAIPNVDNPCAQHDGPDTRASPHP